jgi:hypothetical protein
MNWKNIEKNICERLEKGLIFLCYSIGMGSILFGSLSGTAGNIENKKST